MVIVGSQFGGTTSVDFGSGDPAAAFMVLDTHLILAFAPFGHGTVDVTVTTGAGTSAVSDFDRFTYKRPSWFWGSSGSELIAEHASVRCRPGVLPAAPVQRSDRLAAVQRKGGGRVPLPIQPT